MLPLQLVVEWMVGTVSQAAMHAVNHPKTSDDIHDAAELSACLSVYMQSCPTRYLTVIQGGRIQC